MGCLTLSIRIRLQLTQSFTSGQIDQIEHRLLRCTALVLIVFSSNRLNVDPENRMRA